MRVRSRARKVQAETPEESKEATVFAVLGARVRVIIVTSPHTILPGSFPTYLARTHAFNYCQI